MTDGQRMDEALKNWINHMRYGIRELREWTLRQNDLHLKAVATTCPRSQWTPETYELLETLLQLGEEWEIIVTQGA